MQGATLPVDVSKKISLDSDVIRFRVEWRYPIEGCKKAENRTHITLKYRDGMLTQDGKRNLSSLGI